MERNVRFETFLFLKNINILYDIKDMFLKEEIIQNLLDLNNIIEKFKKSVKILKKCKFILVIKKKYLY